MNKLQKFTDEEFGEIRTVTIDGEPYFVGKDVAEALGYAKPTDAVRKRVEDEDRGISKMETPSGFQDLVVINESGLYALIFGSKLESARKFKHWVTSEVLPSIRQTGKYEMPTYLNPASAGGVASLINTFARGLKEQGCTPEVVATRIERIGRQCGVDVIENYVLPNPYKQMSLLEATEQ